jgi:cobaltochelatase CobN
MHLVDEAVRRVMVLDEPPERNFVRKHWLAETQKLLTQGRHPEAAQRAASYRVFSSKPGAYGTGLMELIDAGAWSNIDDLARAAVLSGGWAYSPENADGVEATDSFRRRLAGIELVLHNQDNREQDLFDSSDYFEFHGGLIAAVAAASSEAPQSLVSDTSDPAHPQVRTLKGEALRVYRSRVVNPKWLEAIQRHGYRGGLELAATVDALFGFAATAGVITDWMFEGIADTFAGGGVRQFLQKANPWALNAIAERLLEADRRQVWIPKPETRERLREILLDSEASMESAVEVSP